MFDKQLLEIPGVRKALAVCTGASLADALIIYAQCAALAYAIVGIWEGGALGPQLIYIAAFFAFFAARKAVQNALSAYMDGFAALTCDDIGRRLHRAIYIMGPFAAARYGTAALVGNLCEGMDSIEEYLRMILPRTVAVLTVPLVLLALMFAYDQISAFIALVMYPFIVIFMRLIGQGAKAEATRRHKQFERMSNNFLDTAAGVDTLSAFSAGPAFSESIFRASERFRRLTMKTLRIAMLSSTVLDIFSTLAIAAVAIMMGFRMVEGTLAFLPALLILMLLPYYFQPIKDYGSNYHATLDGKTALDAADDAIRCAAGIDAPASVPMLGNAHTADIALESISYSYGQPEGGAPAGGIHDVDLVLRSPCKVGIFGESGAGKSTLLNILAGFASPTAGAIRADGEEVRTLHAAEWLSRVAYIPQAPYIFHATLRENLTFYNPSAAESDIAHAIAAMGLEELVEQLPDGLDTELGRGSRKLSGGQAQRVAVARALLDPDRDVWILDEPTAHLDIETEYELKMRLLPLMEGKLVVIATHRTHWERDMDLCVLMEDGAVVSVTEGGSR